MYIILIIVELLVEKILIIVYIIIVEVRIEFYLVYYLIFSVFESVLGLGLLVIIVRFRGNDLYYILGCQISPFRFFPLYSMLYKKCYSDRI